MIELLGKKHNRECFDCGKELLNNYLKTQAGQDIQRKLSACFVLSENETDIQGYYTLSNNSIPLKETTKIISFYPYYFTGKISNRQKASRSGNRENLAD